MQTKNFTFCSLKENKQQLNFLSLVHFNFLGVTPTIDKEHKKSDIVLRCPIFYEIII